MKKDAFLQAMSGCRLPAWEMIPDFGLYMDQVLTYTEAQLPTLSGFLGLTAAMVNNYVKAGLVDRPKGKKYSRTSIAQLLMICLLKQTISQESIRRLLLPAPDSSPEELYAGFRRTVDRMISRFSGEIPSSALTCALESASLHLICRLLLTEEEEP